MDIDVVIIKTPDSDFSQFLKIQYTNVHKMLPSSWSVVEVCKTDPNRGRTRGRPAADWSSGGFGPRPCGPDSGSVPDLMVLFGFGPEASGPSRPRPDRPRFRPRSAA